MSNGEDKKIIYSMYKVSRHHGTRQVIKDISLSYFYGAKIGVIGLNGSGKSTVLKIMAGVDTEYNGEISISPGFTIGYLEQEPQLEAGKTVKDIVSEGAQETVDLLNAEYDAINEAFGDPDADMDKLLERQGEVQEKLDAINAWDLDARLEWPWTPCAARRGMQLWTPSFRGRTPPGGSVPPAACSSRTSCCWTSPPTTWMPRASPGSSVTCSSTRER
jgi:energy-coupling factor transporter ATP-binding protein EcfA2